MAADKKTITEHTEPMLTDGEIVEKYRLAAKHYNAMASACRFVGVPETLHDALYKTRHGEADIRAAVKVAHDIARDLADGLVSLMLVCRLRQEFAPKTCPGCGWSVDCEAKTTACKLGKDCHCGSPESKQPTGDPK